MATLPPARWSFPSAPEHGNKDEGGETNIRKGPGTKYDIVGKVKDNSYILYSGEYGDKWYKVYTQAGALRGYISANKLEPLESPAF